MICYGPYSEDLRQSTQRTQGAFIVNRINHASDPDSELDRAILQDAPRLAPANFFFAFFSSPKVRLRLRRNAVWNARGRYCIARQAPEIARKIVPGRPSILTRKRPDAMRPGVC